MHRTRDLLAPVSLVLFALSGCAAPKNAGATRPPEEELDDGRQPVTGGQIANKYRAAALLDIAFGSQTSLCSGALIGAQAVLTAKHCVDVGGQPPDTVFVRAPYAQAPHTTATFASVVTHPSLDVAVVFLKQGIALPAGHAYPTPALLPVADGTNVEVVGRLQNGVASFSDMFSAPTTVSVKDASMYASPALVECGDSGGPVFAIGNPQAIIAVNTAITNVVPGTCQATNATQSLYTRVDISSALLGWIGATLATPPESTPASGEADCGGIGWEGACTSDVLAYCDEGTLATIDCGAYGGSCGAIGDDGFDCLYAGDPCGGVTYEGQCEGDVLQWCESGGTSTIDCSAIGELCGWSEEAQYYDCL